MCVLSSDQGTSFDQVRTVWWYVSLLKIVLRRRRTQPAVGWGHYTNGLKDKGRPVETLEGKDTPGPQYQLDK